MKIRLTEKELMNIVSNCDIEFIMGYSRCSAGVWKIEKNYSQNGDEFYELEMKVNSK